MIILLDKAIKYANDVVYGIEITTKEVKLQCEIFLNDLENQESEYFEYYFDEKIIRKVNNLLKLINFADGIDVTGMTVLEGIVGFQAFLLVNIFGWRYKINKIKMRYRDVILYIARKNAKTFIVAIIFILLLLLEPNYSEFYSICLSKDLAAEVRKAIVKTIECSPALSNHFKCSKTFTGKIECKLTHSFFQPRVAEAGKNNSIKPSAFVSDEHAFFSDKSNYNAMRSGQRNVINPITFITTTAYAESNSIMNDDLDYAKKVLNGDVDDSRLFALIYYAEKGHEWDDIGLKQANPLRIEENYDEIRSAREKAKIILSEEEEYLTKSMNVMLESNEENKYVSMEWWKKCRVKKVDFEGKEVIVGIDLSVTNDLTAVSIMYRDGDYIYCKSHGFKPEIDTNNRREKINYKMMEKKGYCDIHKGRATISYTKVEEYIRNIETMYNCKIKYLVTDPMNAKEMMERLSEDYDVIMLKQSYTMLSPATKEFRKLIYDGKVFYEENALLDWCMSNAITTVGKSDDEMLAKENKNKDRIDMVAVLIFAYTQLIIEEEKYDPIAALEESDW